MRWQRLDKVLNLESIEKVGDAGFGFSGVLRIHRNFIFMGLFLRKGPTVIIRYSRGQDSEKVKPIGLTPWESPGLPGSLRSSLCLCFQAPGGPSGEHEEECGRGRGEPLHTVWRAAGDAGLCLRGV